jgi:peptidoglycan/LPS O-acetylase OafA/YrhL
LGTASELRQSPLKVRIVRPKPASDDMPNLDFLRAVAVLLVLFSHVTYYRSLLELGPMRMPWMGGVGVYFFFVHTCYVLMLSIERQWKGQGAVQLFGSFLIRRVFRIYPLSIAAVLLVLAFRLPMAGLYPGHFVRASPNLTMIISNLLLVQGPGGSVLGVMWSLPYEMAMYLFLPWIFLFLHSNRSLWRIAGIWSISVLAGVVFLIYTGWPIRDYFLLYIPCFLPGVIAYQLQKMPRRQLPAVLWPVVVLLTVPLFLYKQNLVSDSRIKSWVVCLLIGVAVPFFAQISGRWITVPSSVVSRYSYGIYLTHCFCIWLVFDRLHYVLPKIVRLGLFVILLAGLPVLFYHCLEEPMILFGKRVARRFEELASRDGRSGV